jgi:hypothetical protein
MICTFANNPNSLFFPKKWFFPTVSASVLSAGFEIQSSPVNPLSKVTHRDEKAIRKVTSAASAFQNPLRAKVKVQLRPLLLLLPFWKVLFWQPKNTVLKTTAIPFPWTLIK